VAADEIVIGAAPPRHVEPRQATRRAAIRRTFRTGSAELHYALRRAKAHARHGIHDHAQAIPARQIIAPRCRLRAPHLAEEITVVRCLQRCTHFARQRCRLLNAPLRQQAGMDHRIFAFDMEQRQPTQPGQQVVAIRSRKNFCQRILTADFAVAIRQHRQMQIVVTENDRRTPSQTFDQAQDGERVRAAIDQVANQPQAVACRREAQVFEQADKFSVATLNVADSIGGHRPTLP